jgi:hypothetical protein
MLLSRGELNLHTKLTNRERTGNISFRLVLNVVREMWKRGYLEALYKRRVCSKSLERIAIVDGGGVQVHVQLVQCVMLNTMQFL